MLPQGSVPGPTLVPEVVVGMARVLEANDRQLVGVFLVVWVGRRAGSSAAAPSLLPGWSRVWALVEERRSFAEVGGVIGLVCVASGNGGKVTVGYLNVANGAFPERKGRRHWF